MKNKKGFTLIELLAVIVIIAIVSIVAAVGITSIKTIINKNLLSSKIDIIESGAVLWGQDNMTILVSGNNTITYDGNTYNYAAEKTVNELSAYITGSDTCTDENGNNYTCVKNDVTYEDMGESNVIIYVENNRVYAKYIEE